MSPTDWDTLTTSTNFYQGQYSTSCCSNSASWDNQDFTTWQNESYDIATTLYAGVYENQVVP